VSGCALTPLNRARNNQVELHSRSSTIRIELAAWLWSGCRPNIARHSYDEECHALEPDAGRFGNEIVDALESINSLTPVGGNQCPLVWRPLVDWAINDPSLR